MCSVQLVRVRGLEPELAPSATSLALDLVGHVHNGHVSGGVAVSYAGVPLVRGCKPNLRLAAKEAGRWAASVTGVGVRMSAGLSRLMNDLAGLQLY